MQTDLLKQVHFSLFIISFFSGNTNRGTKGGVWFFIQLLVREIFRKAGFEEIRPD